MVRGKYPETSTAVISEASVESLRDILEDSFVEILEAYIRDSKARIERLEKALGAQDYHTVLLESHGLKGSSINLDAHALVQVCERLEHDAKQGMVEDMQQQLTALRQNFAAVCEALKPYLP